MTFLGDFLWQPRRLFKSVGEWADASGNTEGLIPLPGLPQGDSAPQDTNPGRWHLASLPNGKVIGDLRLVATWSNDVLGQIQVLHGIEAPETHWALRQSRLRRPRRLRGTAAVLAAAGGTNYYHWIFDSLPRLHLLRLAGVEWRSVKSFLINGTVQSFDVDSLALLGIPTERTVRCSKRQITIAERLLVPPMPLPRQGQVEGWVCEFLRASYLPVCPAREQGLRLYLSRRSSPKRRLANEAAVEALFRENGFRVVRLEALSFQEQVATFAGAALVAGPHGAGFANLVFAPPGTGVIEFFHPNHRAPNYERIASLIGMNYRSVIGEAPGERADEMSETLGPYTVSLELLKQALTDLQSR